ncbi:Putative S-adenosyl-L-methionine-dependent methyltransferase [Halomicronema hongdechloris C2206]|uniref:S-adenosyl-L-methionine-dependent methyltransferase n=1 Tax=Halomicronema hongdechloris C2206 TaxID=1641165 RepID=A0A1Z3HR19_9CYAN|nr:Putative S-adenosyl-L-methionine-dependent methyltransferase [Halomicronema hongdechloris C2206]
MLRPVPPACDHHLIDADLEESASHWITSLIRAGYQRERPTLWLLEGVAMYLPESSLQAVLQAISDLSAPESQLGLDEVTLGSLAAAGRARHQDRGRVIRHWRWGCDDPRPLLAAYGWQAEIYQPQRVCPERYPPSLPINAELGGHQTQRGVWLLMATNSYW